MAYALKYRCEFSSIKNIQYRLDIEEKNYSGDFYTLQAAGKPVVHKWQNEQPKPPIKGASLTLNYLNKGNQPLAIFYSNEDDTFKATYTCLTSNEILFVGFLVQDDCNELEISYTHEVSLAFNDSLGLLKEVNLRKAFEQYIFPNLLVGKQSLATVVFACLQATNINLPINIYCNLYEATIPTKQYSTFQNTLIDTDTFLTNETTYDNCYNVLTKIFNRFECTLIQTNGSWSIIRWAELKYYGTSIAGWIWDKDFNQLGSTVLDNVATFGENGISSVQSGLLKRLQRPFNFVKETFNYRSPNGLLKNSKLNILGTLRNTLIDGTNIITEYDLPNWNDTIYTSTSQRRIQIIKNNIGVEIGRYILIKGNTTDVNGARATKSDDIEIAKGDIIEINFKFRTIDSSAITALFFRFGIYNSPPISTGAIFYADEEGTWTPTTGAWRYEAVGNLQEWQTFSAKLGPAPFDGIFNVFLGQFGDVNSGTIYSDISFKVVYSINDSINVIGQTHNTNQNLNIKNNNDETIEIDDSPRNSISGTLFVPQKTSLLYTRTKTWKTEIGGFTLILGNYITYEKLFQKRIVRTILEGSFLGILQQNNKCISALSIMLSENYFGLNFVFGNLEIDYRNESYSGTLFELFRNGETFVDLVSDYNFNYLYENK